MTSATRACGGKEAPSFDVADVTARTGCHLNCRAGQFAGEEPRTHPLHGGGDEVLRDFALLNLTASFFAGRAGRQGVLLLA